MADALVNSGLAALGYRYVNLDDCVMVERDASGRLVPDPARFPSGLRALADYIHGKGLFFGLYTSATELTCQRRPASYMHEATDAASYCDWGIE